MDDKNPSLLRLLVVFTSGYSFLLVSYTFPLPDYWKNRYFREIAIHFGKNGKKV